jgi:hypothetical protein
VIPGFSLRSNPGLELANAFRVSNPQKKGGEQMPHFIIDCSEHVIQQKSPDEIMQAVYDVAEAALPQK